MAQVMKKTILAKPAAVANGQQQTGQQGDIHVTDVASKPVTPATNNHPTVQQQQEAMTSADANGPTVLASNAAADERVADDLETKQSMANTKEKTAMCLVNELARYNKIQHQYTLTDEQGPAHKKTFYVKLKLDSEEYSSSGPSIKKAQHSCASIALENTKFTHPVPKPRKRGDFTNYNDSITPTVELNALVMKRGEPTSYHNVEVTRPQYYSPPNMDFRGMYTQRYHYPRHPKIFCVSLRVGQREFIADGASRQEARHNAAIKALNVLRNLPLPDPATKAKMLENEESQVEKELPENDQDDLKSEISLVHEIALKRNLSVMFEVKHESGPPHMKTFVTQCKVGDQVTEGEGNGKKVSKKRAAEQMLEALRRLPPLDPVVTRPKRAPVTSKKKNRNLIKLQKSDPTYGVGINPISRLIQIQQAKKEKEPVYTLVSERGVPRRREFVMQVQVGDHSCTGVGPNKKLAKRSAAEAMLLLLGYSRPQPQPGKPAIKSPDAQFPGTDKKVKFMDQETHVRPLPPGLLLMPEGTGPHAKYHGVRDERMTSNVNPHTTATIAKELLDTGISPTAESLNSTNKPGDSATVGNQSAVDLGRTSTLSSTQTTVRPKQQLLYLADVLGFRVQFTDFPKGPNKREFLSLVSLSTVPPHVSHGAAATIEQSHDSAAHQALKALADVGLENLTCADVVKMEDGGNVGAGDGPHVKNEIGEVNSIIKVERD